MNKNKLNIALYALLALLLGACSSEARMRMAEGWSNGRAAWDAKQETRHASHSFTCTTLAGGTINCNE